jgi:RNA polymerase sigma-70 factor (ECF subfamily)
MAEYRGALARLASAYLTDPADRDDLVQEIATAIWQAIPRFRGDSSERTWLYRIAHNTAITTAARVRRRFRTETALDGDFPTNAGVDERLVEEQHRKLLLARVRALPDELQR